MKKTDIESKIDTAARLLCVAVEILVDVEIEKKQQHESSSNQRNSNNDKKGKQSNRRSLRSA